MYQSFLIHSSADGRLGCFHVLAIINSAAMNVGVHVSLSDLVSSVCMPSSGIAGSYGSSMREGVLDDVRAPLVPSNGTNVALQAKNPPADAGDAGSIPGSGRCPGGGHGNPPISSCLENPMDRAWRAAVHGATESQT